MKNLLQNVKVENMKSGQGNDIPNQFIIETNEGLWFQSYRTVIAFKPLSGPVCLDERAWDCSRTTSKYRSLFLNEPTAETKKKIKEGIYQLVNLNK